LEPGVEAGEGLEHLQEQMGLVNLVNDGLASAV
jgi:hypothetical protein